VDARSRNFAAMRPKDSARGNVAGRSTARAPKTSASAGTSQSKDCPIAWVTRASRIGRSVGNAAERVREYTTAAAPPSAVMGKIDTGENRFPRRNERKLQESLRQRSAPALV
jgi:hypothetical protein